MTLVSLFVNESLNWNILRHRLPSLSWTASPPPRTLGDALIFRWGRNHITVLCWIQIDGIWSFGFYLFLFCVLISFLLYWSCQKSTEWFHVRWQMLFVGLKGAATDRCRCGDGWQWWYLTPCPRVSGKLVYWFPVACLIAWLTDWPASPSLELACKWCIEIFSALHSMDPLALGAYRWLLTPPSWPLLLRKTQSRCCCVSFPWRIRKIGFISRIRVWLTPPLCFP